MVSVERLGNFQDAERDSSGHKLLFQLVPQGQRTSISRSQNRHNIAQFESEYCYS